MADFGLSEVAMGVMAASTAVGVMGTIAGSQAQASSLNNQAAVAEQNAAIATQTAAYNAQIQQRQLNKTVGSAIATEGGNGAAGGSIGDITYDSLLQGNLQQLMTTWQGQVQATSSMNQASALQANAQNTLEAGGMNAVGQIAKGVGGELSMYDSSTGYGLQPNIYGASAGMGAITGGL